MKNQTTEKAQADIEKFSLDNLESELDFKINSLIMEQASDTAELLTEGECKLNDINCWTIEGNEQLFTKEAQDIFDVFYDEQVEQLYSLLNNQLKEIRGEQ